MDLKSAFFDERFPYGKKIGIIEGEHMNRNATNRRSAGRNRSIPFKVFSPQVVPWMVETNKIACVRVGSRKVRSLMTIAMQAGEREIIQDGCSSMLTCNDVIGMEGQRIAGSGKLAVLATAVCPLPDLPEKIDVHAPGGLGRLFSSARRALDCITASRFPT